MCTNQNLWSQQRSLNAETASLNFATKTWNFFLHMRLKFEIFVFGNFIRWSFLICRKISVIAVWGRGGGGGGLPWVLDTSSCFLHTGVRIKRPHTSSHVFLSSKHMRCLCRLFHSTFCVPSVWAHSSLTLFLFYGSIYYVHGGSCAYDRIG